MKTQYAYTKNEETYYGPFKSIEEAIVESGADVGEDVMIGIARDVHPYIDALPLLDQLECDMSEECGEAAEGWISTITREERQELEDMLNRALKRWMKKTNNTPSFFGVSNDTVKGYEVTGTNGEYKKNEATI